MTITWHTVLVLFAIWGMIDVALRILLRISPLAGLDELMNRHQKKDPKP